MEDRVKETIISLCLTNLTADGSLEAPMPWKGGGSLKSKSRQRPCLAACHQASRAQRAPGQGRAAKAVLDWAAQLRALQRLQHETKTQIHFLKSKR